MRTNIIEARFKGGTVTETLPVYQWDYGQILTFPDLSLPANYEVHFARGMRTIATVLGDASGVQVPDALLQRSGALTVYIYMHSGENDGETVYTIRIPVIARAPVSDEQPDPVEVDAISQAITALNQAKNGIEETVSSALQEAKDSGEFNGVSPAITVTDIEGGHRITITDATGAHSFDVLDGQDGEDGAGAVQDVQVNGVSVLQDGVANVPVASDSSVGVMRGWESGGTHVLSDGRISIQAAPDSSLKAGSSAYQPVVATTQHKATFYGLAKAAGSDEKNSTLPVGQYTESAKSAISEMLNGSVSVEGTTPTINAMPGVRYVCGEVSTITINTPSTGIVDVVFESGSTPAVLTVVPPSGMTMRWANGFDPSSLEADTVYEVNVMDGCLGVAGVWT